MTMAIGRDRPSYARSPAGRGGDLKLAANRADPIAHADQPDAGWPDRHRHPDSVVAHLKLDFPTEAAAKSHGHPRIAARMFDRVLHRLEAQK